MIGGLINRAHPYLTLGIILFTFASCATAPSAVKPDAPVGTTRALPVLPPPTLRDIPFKAQDRQIREEHPLFAAGAVTSCQTLIGFTCGYELGTEQSGVESLYVVAPRDQIHKLTGAWGPPRTEGAGETWIDVDTGYRATTQTYDAVTRVNFSPVVPLEDLIAPESPILGFEQTPLLELNQAGVETEHPLSLRRWSKGEIEQDPKLFPVMGDHLKVRSSKRPALTIGLPGTELSELPIYVRPRFAGASKRVKSFELVIPYGGSADGPTRIHDLLEQKYGPGVAGKRGDAEAMVYGDGPQIYAWDEAETRGFHLKVVDVSDGEAFKGWWKGTCLGFAGHWKGRFSGRSVQGAHYLDGRVYPSGDKCRARFSITFEGGPGTVVQVMAVTAAKNRIKMRGLSFKGNAAYHRRGGSYALDTFYMSPDDAVDVLRGTIRDTRKAHGSIVLRRK
ncbi:MAG: hypothetical protein VX938_09125 [Myxococcota bacterium]|nr:hypothetical protein [Myxococcota bacterium]